MTNIINEIRNLFLWFNTNPDAAKITIGTGIKGEHYTIRFWNKRKCFDLHFTNEISGHHETILEIKYFTLFRLLIKLSIIQRDLLIYYWMNNTIRLGKLKHHNCILFAFSTDKNDLNDIIKINDNRFKFKKNPDLSSLNKFYINPDEILSSTSEIFYVLKRKKGNLIEQGVLYKLKNRKNTKQFIFVSNKTQSTFNKQTAIVTYNLLQEVQFEYKDKILMLLYEKIKEKYGFRTLNN